MNDFVPDGWLTFHDAMKHVSHARFGAAQTPDYAAESNLLEAANWIRNRAFDGELKTYTLNLDGEMHEIFPKNWGNGRYCNMEHTAFLAATLSARKKLYSSLMNSCVS